MNTKKLLAMLLSGLGVFALGLTGCDTPETSSEPSVEPTPDSSDEASPDASTDNSVDSSEESSSTDPDPVVDPTLKTYNVNFNYDDVSTGMSVWTDYEIDASIAPMAANISGYAEDRRTVPLNEQSTEAIAGSGFYYIAVDADGYIIYASYGLGSGSGSPCDDYYHNQPSKDYGSADYFATHDDYAFWPNTTVIDGVTVNAWTLYDFLVPTDGFVVKGYYNDASESGFVKLWNQVFVTVPDATAPHSNWAFNAAHASGTFNKWYLSINENHELEVRERGEGEMVDANGDQEKATPSKNFETKPSDAVITYTTFEGLATMADGTAVENVKAVVTYVVGDYVFVQDVQGTNVLVYKPNGEVAVGDTIVINGTKGTFGGHEQVNAGATVTKLEGYGRLESVEAIEVNAENVAETFVPANNNAYMKLVKAVVKEIDAAGTSVVTVGETDVKLYKAEFPATVAVGDTVDVVCAMSMYNDALQVRVASASDMSRYYNVTVDVDGSEGVEESITKGYASGETVTMSVKSPSDAYVFSHWAQVTKDAEGAEVLTEVSKEADLTITVGEEDVEYRAVFTFAPWANLSDAHVLELELAGGAVNSGDASLAIFTTTDALNAAVTTSGNNKWIANGWRTTLIVDGEGKVAVVSYNAAYCGLNPTSNFYGRHSSYADPANNPAFVIAEDGTWSFAIPEGGFAVSMHTNNIDEIFAALGIEKTYVPTTANLDEVRLFLDKGNNNLVKVFNSEANADVELNGLINATGGLPTVYNDTAENVKLGDFSVAVDANGKIIFAGRTSDGYSGPADGFYHDGSYQAVAGQQCGIFVLDEQFAGWPAVTPDGVNAWTLYTVKVPTGGHIITGTEAQMTEFMKAIDPAFVANQNYFEGVADGMFNETHTIAVAEQSKVAHVDLTITEAVSSEGLAWGGATMGDFTYNNGVYEATVSLNAWGAINFTYTDAEGNSTLLTFDNTTFAGDITSDPTNFGAYAAGAGILFIEEGWPAEGKFMASDAVTLDITYDTETHTLTVARHTDEEPTPDPDPTPEPVHVNMMVPTTVDVITSATENVALKDVTIAVDATGKVIFASFTAPGYGGPADGFYHDGTYAVVAGQQCGIFLLDPEFAGWPAVTEDGRNAWGLYTVKAPEGVTIYTGAAADMLPLVNAIFGVELTEMTNNGFFENTAVDGAYNHVVATLTPMVEVNYEHAADLSVYTSADETATLEDVTVAVDATGKVIFASYTAPGYGGPADGFYHDGTYAVVAGQQCGIFLLDPEFAGWPAVTEDGRNAWNLYTVKAPEGVTIYTGTVAEMLPLVNAAFGVELTEMTNNGFFENTVADGANNHRVVTLTAAAPVEPDPIVVSATFSKAFTEGFTYITNNSSYPNPSWYSDGGLKMNYENMGVLSGTFEAASTVEVTLNINALNENTKTGKSGDAFKVYGLDASGAVVAEAGLATVAKGSNTVTLEGEGIVQVKVMMTAYPHNGNKYCNVSLGGVTLTIN